jgi:pyruvate kinase
VLGATPTLADPDAFTALPVAPRYLPSGTAVHVRHTKILATVGPATSSHEQLTRILKAGADALRLNLAHGSVQEHHAYLRAMHAAVRESGREVAIVVDIPGPKIRLGRLAAGELQLQRGETWNFDTDATPGDAQRVQLAVPSFRGVAKPGDPILLGDGSIELQVVHAAAGTLHARVLSGGVVRQNTGVYLPRARLKTSAFTPADRRLAEPALESGVDFLAVSFVRDAVDLAAARHWLDRFPAGKDVGLIAKIERAEALKAVDGILADSDGIMVARGDLGVEVPLERLALEQKQLVDRANAAGRFVVVATQVLLSMVTNARPSRAEATDVANAVLDGADALMLSEESAIGLHPVEAVEWLGRIAEATEGSFDPRRTRELVREFTGDRASLPERSVAMAAVALAERVNASVIVAPTHTGRTAHLLASLRPRCPVIALTRRSHTRRRLALVRGVHARPAPTQGRMVELRHQAIQLARSEGFAREGPLVLTLGFPVDGRPTNLVTLVDPTAATDDRGHA